ncbi:MAG: ATP-binding protein [Spirulinaceae cyanobacterium]
MKIEEVEQLRYQVAALEELLAAYEFTTTEKSNKLEQALENLRDRAQQLEHAQETLHILQSILDSMGDGVAVVNEEGKFIFFNPAAEKILGVSHTNASLRDWVQRSNFYLPDQITVYPEAEYPWQLAALGESVDTAEMFLCSTAEPEGIWLSVNARPLKSGDGNYKGGVVVFRDISTRKLIEESLRSSSACFQEQAEQLEHTLQKLRKTQAQLIQTEKMSGLGQMVAGVAHEINNPINFIYGNLVHLGHYSQDLLNLLGLYEKHCPPCLEIQKASEDIEIDYLKEDIPKILSSMAIGTERIQQIVVSLQNFSRLDSPSLQAVDLHEGLDNSLMILQNRLKERSDQAAIEVIKDYEDLPLVECYAGQINQVFMNILSNAIDALEEKENQQLVNNSLVGSKIITIRTEKVGENQVAIYIADNALGMSEKVRQHIFDPFFTTKEVGKGTGLGMSISYQIIVDNHKGKLVCESELGKGTKFTIELAIRHHKLGYRLAKNS